MTLLIKLFFSFMQVGLFSVGGGYAAIPLIQDQIVNIHGLMTMDEFSDLQITLKRNASSATAERLFHF